VTKALSPARVQRVTIVDDEARVMEVLVEDRQLSLAIGKKGQNVRLAAKLTGWKIDIKSDEDKKKEVELQLAGLEFGDGTEAAAPLELPEIHVEVITALKAAGYATASQVHAAGAEALGALPGFDAETVAAVLAAAETVVSRQLAAAAAEPVAEPAAEAVAEPVTEEAVAEAPTTQSPADEGLPD
jgi:N utilization substance protein A